MVPDPPSRVAKENQHSNNQPVRFMRISGNIAGGCVAGLLGLTGFQGAAFYFIVASLISLALLVKTFFQPKKYFSKPFNAIVYNGVFDRSSLLTYVLFWTMLFSFQ